MRASSFLMSVLIGVVGQAYAADTVSPFADKPCNSYSSYNDETGKPAVLLWGKAPLTDFGSRSVTFDTTGVRALRQAPAPGVHPRIMFGPDDLPDVRKRVKETTCGREAWKNILCWTEAMKGRYDDTADYAKPDRWSGGFGGLHGRVPLYRLGAPAPAKGSKYVRSEPAAALWKQLIDGTASEFPAYYWNTLSLEAFRCLIDQDEVGGKECAKALVTMLKLDQAKRDQERKDKPSKKSGLAPAQPVGAFQLAFSYDFLFNWLTPAQKTALHDELAASTWCHDNYGTFNTAESSRSNWATFSYWLFEVLAIEGEPGFNDLKVRGMYRGWRNLLTYGWFQSGATFEGEAKNQLGMDGVILFTMRAKQYGFDNLGGHPYLQAYARKFLPHSANAMLTGFHKYDLLGGSRSSSGGFASTDSIGLKYMFPEDRVIDWYYRQAIKEDYVGVPDRPDGYFNGLLFFAIFASDFMPENKDPKALSLGNTFFCGERALMMTRSSWDPSAMQLNMHTRQANGGHPFADRNAIMVAGAGRIWSPNGYASFATQENSVVSIDGKSQSEIVPGRMVDFVDQPQATFAVGDAKYAWDWTWHRLDKKGGGYYTKADVDAGKVVWPPGTEPVLNTTNDFALLKLPFAYLDRPMTEYGHWLLPNGALSPYAREPRLPVIKAFRTAGLVRGAQPYAVVVDDIQQDATPHRYEWTLALEYDLQIAKVDHRADGICDILLTGSDPDQKEQRPKEPLPPTLATGSAIPAGQPVLLVRVLHGAASGSDLEPTIVELPNVANPVKYSRVRRLVIPSQSITPEFKVLLVPHRQGDVLPVSAWNAAHDEATLGADHIRFAQAASGKTDVIVLRDGKPIITMTKAVSPLRDVLGEQRADQTKQLRARLANFKPDTISGLMPLPTITGATLTSGTIGQVLTCSGGKEGFALPLDLRTIGKSGFTLGCWVKTEDAIGMLVGSNGTKGVTLSIENKQSLRIDAAGQNRWLGNIPMAFTGWHHYAVISDGQSLAILIDGKQVRREPIDKPLQFAQTITLGAGLTGRIADLRVYQRALTNDELANLVNYQRLVQGGP